MTTTVTTVFPLPALSEPDPEVAGEGSLDPLGLASIADRLADLIAPDVRARMSRIRFVTAMAVGAVVTESLWDEPSEDQVSTPPICWEWLVLEAFVRKARETGALDVTGIPGSSKAGAVIAQGKRLSAASYLKTPNVFGFNGVYQPLARGLRVVDDRRLPAERSRELVETWEVEQNLPGFLDRRPGTEGAGLRSRVTEAVTAALRAGRCVTSASAHLWVQLARALPPHRAGPREKELLRTWLLNSEHPVRTEVARALAGRSWTSEKALLDAIRPRATIELQQRIDAAIAYERVSGRLAAVLRTLCHISTLQGTQPLTPSSAAVHPVIVEAASELPAACSRAADALAALDLLPAFEANLGTFSERQKPADLVEQVLRHHEGIQRAKTPRGKRPWFEAYGPGVVVRPPYRLGEPVTIDDATFLHPFRIGAVWQFMEDTRR